jgi:hypothetical protein
MTSHPFTLIQESIERLEQLADFLAGEVRPDSALSMPLPPEKLISKETLLTISVLLPRLHQVRNTHAQAISATRYFQNCED